MDRYLRIDLCDFPYFDHCACHVLVGRCFGAQDKEVIKEPLVGIFPADD
jgi:hypothetical protein